MEQVVCEKTSGVCPCLRESVCPVFTRVLTELRVLPRPTDGTHVGSAPDVGLICPLLCGIDMATVL